MRHVCKACLQDQESIECTSSVVWPVQAIAAQPRDCEMGEAQAAEEGVYKCLVGRPAYTTGLARPP